MAGFRLDGGYSVIPNRIANLIDIFRAAWLATTSLYG